MVAAVVPPLVSSSAISSIFFLASSNPNFSVNPPIPKLSIALTIPSRALPPKPIASSKVSAFWVATSNWVLNWLSALVLSLRDWVILSKAVWALIRSSSDNPCWESWSSKSCLDKFNSLILFFTLSFKFLISLEDNLLIPSWWDCNFCAKLLKLENACWERLTPLFISLISSTILAKFKTVPSISWVYSLQSFFNLWTIASASVRLPVKFWKLDSCWVSFNCLANWIPSCIRLFKRCCSAGVKAIYFLL